ncbi:hypothetical protein ACDC01_004528 [Salmonella enterica]
MDWNIIALESSNICVLKSRPKAVLVDKGYSCHNLRYYLKIKEIIAVIPFKSNEKASQKLSEHA